VRGFDTGPGNMLMDLWCQQRLGLPYDAGGRLAQRGRVDASLLERWLAEPYFREPPPKSTGRELFNESWLNRDSAVQALAHEDMLATLCALTAESAALALLEHASSTHELLVCGGGAFNEGLMQCLAAALGGRIKVASTATVGMAPDRVEALAFAWLARAHCTRHPASLPEVTGAAGARVLGAMVPAR
jgi:anhydro-N-acetylmuramic acid kinase